MSGTSVIRFLLRVPQDVYEALQDLAEREQRSVNGQIVYILQRFIAESRDENPEEGKAAA